MWRKLKETKVEIGQLQAGQWTFIATAKNKDGKEIAAGDTKVTVEAKKPATAQITVRPLEGSGILQVNVSWPGLAEPAVVATLAPVGGKAENIKFTLGENGRSASYVNMDLAAGYYLLRIELQDSGKTVGNVTEAVRVIKDQTTVGNYKMEAALDDIVLKELEDDWIFYYKTSGLASGKVVDGEFVVTVDKVPDNHWDIELIKENLLLKAGYIYVFSLDARADHERIFSFTIGGGEDKNWYAYGTSEPILNTEMRTYFVIVTMPETIASGRLTMSFGQELGTVYIDNVQFKEFPASEAGNFPWIPPFPAGTTTGPELIQNGDFSDGDWNWKFKVRELAEATGQVIAGEFVATITTSSEENWHVSLSQDNITLEKGCSYILSFDARADHDRPIVVGVGLDPYYIGHWPPVIITTEMRTYFKMLDIPVTSDNWGFGFNLSEDTGDVYIDNVSLKKLSW